MNHKELPRLRSDNHIREKNLRPVRIDSKTVILVSEHVTDEQARSEFLLKAEQNQRRFDYMSSGRSRNEIQKAIKNDTNFQTRS